MKNKKLKKINEIAERFINASNHGGNNNWWYPKRDRIAYKIKMSSYGFSYDDIKDKLSEKQKDFCKNIDDKIEEFYYNTLNNESFSYKSALSKLWMKLNDAQEYATSLEKDRINAKKFYQN